MPVRAITFDFWRTLFRDNEAVEREALRARAMCEMTGAAYADVEAALSGAYREFNRCHIEEQRTLMPADAVRLACESLALAPDDGVCARLAEIFAEAIVHHSPLPIEGALDAVKTAAAHCPIGIISDTGVSPGASLIKLLDRHGFTPHFTVMVFSGEMGVSKPQRKMFEAAAKKLGVQIDELLHIGDLELTDIAGAHAVGAKAALFAGDNTRHLHETAADYAFTAWAQFIDQLPRIVE